MALQKKPLLVYHGNSGGGKALKKIDRVYNKLLAYNLFDTIDLFFSKSVEQTYEKIKEVHKTGENDLLISYGGDGTISSLANCLMEIPRESRLPILPLPGGSGNSLLRDFKLKELDGVIKRYMENRESFYDVLRVTFPGQKKPWYCINMIGMGFISDVADYVHRKGKLYGQFSYLFGILLCLGNFNAYHVTVTDGGSENSGEPGESGIKKVLFDSKSVYFMTVSNTKYTGGAIKVAPDASFSDGKMDIVVLHGINRLQFLKGFTKTFKGNHIGERGCEYFQASKIEITADPAFRLLPDGDFFGKSPLTIDVLSAQIKMVL